MISKTVVKVSFGHTSPGLKAVWGAEEVVFFLQNLSFSNEAWTVDDFELCIFKNSEHMNVSYYPRPQFAGPGAREDSEMNKPRSPLLQSP